MLNRALHYNSVSASRLEGSPSICPTTAWFAVQVKYNFEASVATHLRNTKLEVVLPVCRTRRAWSDRIKTVEVPLFPGYVFCEFDPRNRMAVDLIPGVTGVVGFGNKLAEVDRGEISAIRSVLAAGLEVAPWPRLEVGRKVEIHRGPLRGLVGVIVGDRNNHRLILSVTILNRSVSVEMDRHWFRLFD